MEPLSPTDVSVLIVTYRRTDALKAALSSLLASLRLSGLSFEFLIGVNGDDDESVQLAQKLLSGERCSIQTLCRQTPASARNEVLNGAHGQWVYFSDDDIMVPENFFRSFLSVRDSHSEVTVVGGPNLTPPLSSRFQKAAGSVLSSPFGAAACARRYRPGTGLKFCDESSLILCNLFVHATLLNGRVFPDGFVCAEENAALEIWRRQGRQMVTDADLAVFHERRPTSRGFAQQIFKYGRGRGRLVAKAQCRWFHLVPTVCLAAVSWMLLAERWWLLTASIVTYTLLIVLQILRERADFASILLFPLVHTSYALGVIYGFGEGVKARIRAA